MKPAAQRYDDRRAPNHFQWELGGKALLGIVLGLAVVCGMFFSFGYTMGRHAIPATFTLGAAPSSAASTPPAPPSLPAAETPAEAGADAGVPPTATPPPAADGVAPATPTAPAVAPTPAPTPPVTPPPAAAGQYQVQVFTGSKSDADSVALALRARGFPAAVALPSPGESDAMYRVRVGPFANSDDANTSRSRLSADGYANAVVLKLP